MSDLPDYALLHPVTVAARFPDYPHNLALLPDGLTLAEMSAVGRVTAAFLVDRDCGFDTLNGRALTAYLDQRIPVKIHAQRARDLRPFLRRVETLAARGYRVEVFS